MKRLSIFDLLKYEKENQTWLDKSSDVAMLVLEKMERDCISKKELSIKLGISVKAMSKILSGRSDLSLKTIVSMEKVLGISLIEILNDIVELKESPIIEEQKEFRDLRTILFGSIE